MSAGGIPGDGRRPVTVEDVKGVYEDGYANGILHAVKRLREMAMKWRKLDEKTMATALVSAADALEAEAKEGRG